MAFFDGTIKRGERVLVRLGDIQILGTLTGKDFQGGPGHSAELDLWIIEAVSGDFPRGIDGITVNANSWEIERA